MKGLIRRMRRLWVPTITVVGGLLILLVFAIHRQAQAVSSLSGEQLEWTETILRYQQAHFSHIESIKFRATLAVEPGNYLKRYWRQRRLDSGSSDTSVSGEGMKYVKWFAASGVRYSDITKRIQDDTTGGWQVDAYAWNGNKYQRLTGISEKMFSSTPHPPTDPPAVWNPLFDQYKFAFILGVEKRFRLLSALQDWEPWAHLLSMAIDCNRHTTWQGQSGVTIVFRSPEGLTAEVFFAADRGYLPWYWKITNPTEVPGIGETEYEVKSAVSQHTQLGKIVIPLLAEETHEDGRKDIYRIDKTTIELNVSLKDVSFTIPDSTKYYHQDETGAVLKPATVIAGKNSLASAIIRGIYAGSLRKSMGPMLAANAANAYKDEVIAPVGQRLRARFGPVEGLEMAK